MSKRSIWAAYLFMLLFLWGCSPVKNEKPKVVEELEFTVCSDSQLPDELREIIRDKKEKKFNVSYRTADNIYIAIGYGVHEQSQLCVGIDELFLTNKEIYVSSTLYTSEGLRLTMGEEFVAKGEYSNCPYIVIKCNAFNVPVFFDVS